jgi:glycosyltransferase involved in cell wall biosynthesis
MSEISVIMPVYNQERFVADAIRSILRQTFADFEFVIVDDGSTDRTAEIIASFKDKRIRLIRAEHEGFIKALTLATDAAEGRWLARMDSDDLCSIHRLQKQISFLREHPECNFVTSFYGIVTPNDKFLSPVSSDKWHYLEPADITLVRKPFCDPGTVYDRAMAKEIGYDSRLQWEKTLWYKLLNKGRGAVMEDPLYFSRYRMGSVSRGQYSYPEDVIYELRREYDPENAVREKSADSQFPNIAAEWKCVRLYCAAGDFIGARKTAFEVWRKFPLRRAAIKLVVKSLVARRPEAIRGPAGINLFPVEAPI